MLCCIIVRCLCCLVCVGVVGCIGCGSHCLRNVDLIAVFGLVGCCLGWVLKGF